MDDEVKTRLIRIPAFHYLHVLNRNTNVTQLIIGPRNFIAQEHEVVVLGPEKMLIVLPRHYCVILNPVIRGNENEGKKEEVGHEKQPKYLESVVFDKHGQAKLRHGETEIRFESEDPFPLLPGEKLLQAMTALNVVAANTALKLRASRTFTDRFTSEKPIKRIAGEEWLFEGPRTYMPQVEVEITATIEATIIKPNQALQLQAIRNCIDSSGTKRKAGDMWLVRKEGAYLPQIDEQIVGVVNGIILTEKKALHLKALNTFKDIYGKERKAGEEWLVTSEDTEVHIPDVYEKVVKEVPLQSLSSRQWCVIQNPVGEDGIPQWGQRKLVKGEANFFLKPGEVLEVQNDVYVLGEEEALEVTCLKDFEENFRRKKTNRIAGQTWFLYGPAEYIPPLEVKVLSKRRAVLQLEGLGLYFFYWRYI